jgi:DNA sulfur modification protein DndB
MFDQLNKDAASPLAGKLSPSKSVVGKISRVTFNRALQPVLSSNILSELDEDRRYRLVRNYLNAFEAELNDKGLLTRSAFFEAMFQLFEPIVRDAIATSSNAKRDSLQRIIRPIASISYRTPGGQTVLDRTSIINLMKSTLQSKTPISEEML